ncbi:expressed unknown protein [Seminavis robusta]|uniref:CRAL-TRIO domain-containing protein n=1 Tax=Seminavis robusta TaxID=568900 RepID=A0A9N8EHK9_9STRA|nr:expressed unknown protein [Seminavis robusta]|eukprot:Sro964_g225400.1 n/a (337) ;mRNA; f:5948-6958
MKAPKIVRKLSPRRIFGTKSKQQKDTTPQKAEEAPVVIKPDTPIVIKPNLAERSWRGFLQPLENVACSRTVGDSGSLASIDESMEEQTSSERKRFLAANNGNESKAMEQLQGYLQARNEHQGTQCQLERLYENLITEHGQDYYDWMVASEAAKQAHNVAQDTPLPRIVRVHTMDNGKEACDLDGHRVLHFLPAQLDKSICSLKTYTLAIFLYLDRKLGRDSEEQVTILMDLRAGAGWANPKVFNIMPFIEDTCQLMLSKFPERMHRAIIYPLPYALTCVLRGIVRNVLDTTTSKKLAILSGAAWVDSPLPKQQLLKYVDETVATICEDARLNDFKN